MAHLPLLPPLKTSPSHVNTVLMAISSSRKDRGPRQCAYCDKVYVHKWDLENHIRVRHKGQQIMCTVCKKTFSKNSNMICHMKNGVCGREGVEVNLELEQVLQLKSN